MKAPRLPRSLRLRLVLGLALASCLLWGSVALWRLASLEREMNALLDDRLAASAKMVAGIVQQFQPAAATPAADLATVIARDGVACEVSLVRSEVALLPIARTGDAPEHASHGATGFGHITKGGKAWRTYVLEEHGLRVATADRLDTRTQLVQAAWRAMAWPFALALIGIVPLSWWIASATLRPLQQLQRELRLRPPQDGPPVQAGQDTQELAPVVASLNQLLARMDAALLHEKRWSADAAHELRTPLTAIKTHLQVAQMVLAREAPAPGAEAARQALAQAGQGVAHMQHTLEQLLALAQLEPQHGAHPASGCSGAALTTAVALAIEQSCQRAQAEGLAHSAVQLQQEPPAPAAWDGVHIALPPALLTCALSNLLDNALRHHQGPGPVSLHLQQQAGGIALTVRDAGPGLSPQECARASQRFWRKHAHGPGSGLGLTMVQRIAHSAGGSLQLSPAAPGLQARLWLPAQHP